MAFVTNITCMECGNIRQVTLGDGQPEPKLCYECHEQLAYPINTMKVLYRQFHECLKNREYHYIDFLLGSFNVDMISADMLIGILTITLSWKEELGSRSQFCSSVRTTLTEHYGKNYTDDLLRGLE